MELISTGPPSPLLGFGETAFALHHERRLVDQTFPGWNRVEDWLREAEGYAAAA